MRLNVLFFGAASEAAGERSITIEMPDDRVASDAFRAVLERYPRLSDHKLLFAVNQEYAGGGEVLRDGDELAVFTAVSGG
jgi:molybdopterin converting factor small subunit